MKLSIALALAAPVASVLALASPTHGNGLAVRANNAVGAHRMLKKRCAKRHNHDEDEDPEESGHGGRHGNHDEDDEEGGDRKKGGKQPDDDDDESDPESKKGGKKGSSDVTTLGGGGGGITLTFYGGKGDSESQLANPSCWGGSWQPDAGTAYLAAISTNFDDPPACGTYLKVTYGGNSVVVIVGDLCDDCENNLIDLTPLPFADLADPNIGVLDGASYEPCEKPDDYDEARYGPEQ